MAATIWQKRPMATPDIIRTLAALLPHVTFIDDTAFTWSPENQSVHFQRDSLDDVHGQARLLHEVGHALLGHTSYQTDFSLLTMELEAWECAKKVATQLGIKIGQEHIENCLDTYRDWIHRRSTCPACGGASFQQDATIYHCHNCDSRWRVSPSRFCRAYRMTYENAS